MTDTALYQIEPLTELELQALQRLLYGRYGYDPLSGVRIKAMRATRVTADSSDDPPPDSL